MSGADPIGDAPVDTAEGVEDEILDTPAEAGSDGEYPDITEDQVLEGELVEMVEVAEQIAAERDEYLDLARRVQAEFENYKRRIDGQRIEQVQRAAEALVVEILPVLDACDAAIGHGAQDVGPIQSALLNTLEKRGLAKVDDVDVSFDPLVHEAVLTEAGDGADDEPVVTEIMRSGYAWNGRVVRPAMVKVRG